ncbi:P13 [Pieris rapae granulovirus]|nr:P13 [Pieris rapae granulovirus]
MRCAYVTLVMLGDKYVKGAVALAKSLKSSGTNHELVCLVTNDVTQTQELIEVFTRVIEVSYLYFRCGKMTTERQQKLYNKWIDFSFTKWRCFQLTMYDKCVYLDADQLVLRNVDHLFFFNTPAVCFNELYCKMFKRFECNNNKVYHNDLKEIYDNYQFLFSTGTIVYEPNTALIELIVKRLVVDNEILNQNRFHNGFEEVVLAQVFLEIQTELTQLSFLYVWNAGEYDVLNGKQPYVINYYGEKKPWLNKKPLYMDEFVWWYFYML